MCVYMYFSVCIMCMFAYVYVLYMFTHTDIHKDTQTNTHTLLILSHNLRRQISDSFITCIKLMSAHPIRPTVMTGESSFDKLISAPSLLCKQDEIAFISFHSENKCPKRSITPDGNPCNTSYKPLIMGGCEQYNTTPVMRQVTKVPNSSQRVYGRLGSTDLQDTLWKKHPQWALTSPSMSYILTLFTSIRYRNTILLHSCKLNAILESKITSLLCFLISY